MRKAIAIVLCLVLLVGCRQVSGGIEVASHYNSRVVRFTDEEAGVVCWLYYYGISCLPINQTRLE